MAIGDTVQAGLMRVDSSPIQIAGAAQARANQAFGQALEKTAIGFFQGQAKKKKNQEAIQGLTSLFPDAPPELIKAMAKNPEVMQAKQQHDQLKQQMEIAKMRDATTRSEGGANRAQTADIQEDAKNLREEQKAENNKFFNTLSGSVPTDQLTPEAIERIDRFNTKVGSDDPRRRAEVNDPQAFMERVKADPSSYVQKPVYELQGRDFLSQFDDPGMFQRALAFQQANQPKSMTPEEYATLTGKVLDNKKKGRDLELPVLSKGEQVIDELTAKEYTEYVNLGGKSAVQSKIKKLNKAIQDLEGSDDLNSWLTGILPESMKALLNEKGLSVQQAVESVIQGNLRETLGAAFAQKEGEMFLARGYDARLSDENNIERVKSLLKEIEDRANARTQTFDYFKKNKTMQGYDGPVFTESNQPSSASSFDPQEIDRLYEEKMRLGKARGLR